MSYVIDDVWPDLWAQRHDGEAPPLASALAALTGAAIVATESADPDNPAAAVEFRLHPGVAETIRAATDAELRTTVDDLLAELWYEVCQQALQEEGRGEPTGQLVVRAGLAAAPVRRIIDGERDEDLLLDGLDEIDSAIVQAILAALATPPA